MKNKKLTKKDKENINNRYNNAIECFNWYSLIELRDIFISNKLSNTDKEALIQVTQFKLNRYV
jgi:hypothetical protein